MTRFFAIESGRRTWHWIVTDPAVPVELAETVLREQMGLVVVSTRVRLVRWVAVVVGAVCGAWAVWQFTGWTEWPSFVLPAGLGALIALLSVDGLRRALRSRLSGDADLRERISTHGVVVSVPEVVRSWAEPRDDLSMEEVLQLTTRFEDAGAAASRANLWDPDRPEPYGPHATAVVGPIFAAEYEARRAELDELAGRLGFTVPADFPPSLDD